MLLPFLADPALVAIAPHFSVLDVLLPEHAGENHLAHVASHGIVHQDVIRHFVDADKHHCDLSRRLALKVFQSVKLDALPDSVDLESVLEQELVFVEGAEVRLPQWVVCRIQALLIDRRIFVVTLGVHRLLNFPCGMGFH